MARFSVGSGIDNYIQDLEQLANATNGMIGRSIYVGGGMAYKAVKEAIDTIPKRRYERSNGGTVAIGITDVQRDGLKESLGIARMRIEGSYHNVKIGFDGYNDNPTENYPSGQPNALIARIVESGSQYQKKTPFVDNTMRANKDAIEKAMAQEFESNLEKFNGGK